MATRTARDARLEDLPAMLELYAQLHPEEPPLPHDRADVIWAQMLAMPGVTVLVIDANGAPASTCTITITPSLARGARPYAHIENVVTLADLRGTGLGHAIIDAALERAWAADCYKVFLTTGSTRESTLRFYEKAGFQKNGRTLFDVRRD